ncbi:MAG: diguanylate cyclase [Geobacter sp.]|nr:MAG: diguanylate cyclase [Geobacter sp.]
MQKTFNFHLWPKPFKYFEYAKLFVITLCAIVAFIVAGIFAVLYTRTSNLMYERVREQAATYADLIMHTKMWNYDYGGVYVEKRRGVASNAYLRQLGVNPDVKVEGGRTFTIRNHAIMIEEISQRSVEKDGVRFHIVSLKPIDPGNAPDQLERTALSQFAQGESEWHSLGKGDNPVFRYLKPLFVEPSCLECHATKGYKVGDVIGAISITLPLSTYIRETRTNKILIIAAAALTICLLVTLIYVLTWRLVIKLDEVQKRLKKLASTDELTGLRNRRHIMKRLEEEFERAGRLNEPLCLIMLDIDHFKRINDTYGHPFGDLVLKRVARRLQEATRSYDITGRIGGEEFLVISPGTTAEEALHLAERLRTVVSQEPMGDGGKEVTITISAGFALSSPADSGSETLLKRADVALYRAKQGGRNRVEAG